MSLNRTLDRLFDEIRREAKRNPDFANRLDAVLRLHDSQRDVPDEIVSAISADQSSPARGGGAERSEAEGGVKPKPPQSVAAAPDSSPVNGGARDAAAPEVNPVALFKREGEDALTEALAAIKSDALRALIVEHNLDPAGETSAMDDAERVAHIVAHAKRRAARDDKMFDY